MTLLRFRRPLPHGHRASFDQAIDAGELLWAVGASATFEGRASMPGCCRSSFRRPNTTLTLVEAIRAAGFRAEAIVIECEVLATLPAPSVVLLNRAREATASRGQEAAYAPSSPDPEDVPGFRIALVVKVEQGRVLYFCAGTNAPTIATIDEFTRMFAGVAIVVTPLERPCRDDDPATSTERFGFRWFVPELLRHRRVWRDVLFASLFIQLIALVVPLCSQVIVDRVIVHQTSSTLTVIAVALAIFLVFSASLSWIRQYLVSHTGNRVDAVLGREIFTHLFRLPLRYFEHRPTGVIAARLHGVETIRDFLSGAAVTLLLDCPFLLLFLGLMLTYSVSLTLITLGILAIIVAMSLAVAPLFQARLNQQFLQGARNQAFLTEYIAGMETVKSLQMEPQLGQRYEEYLAAYLQTSFATRQLTNTYNTSANALEQLMSTAILCFGAWLVMHNADFTIGMLVAFQMFAGRVSQPMLRLVGLWQQFQQASISVQRLADIMNAPAEPYAVVPRARRSVPVG